MATSFITPRGSIPGNYADLLAGAGLPNAPGPSWGGAEVQFPAEWTPAQIATASALATSGGPTIGSADVARFLAQQNGGMLPGLQNIGGDEGAPPGTPPGEPGAPGPTGDTGAPAPTGDSTDGGPAGSGVAGTAGLSAQSGSTLGTTIGNYAGGILGGMLSGVPYAGPVLGPLGAHYGTEYGGKLGQAIGNALGFGPTPASEALAAFAAQRAGERGNFATPDVTPPNLTQDLSLDLDPTGPTSGPQGEPGTAGPAGPTGPGSSSSGTPGQGDNGGDAGVGVGVGDGGVGGSGAGPGPGGAGDWALGGPVGRRNAVAPRAGWAHAKKFQQGGPVSERQARRDRIRAFESAHGRVPI